MPGGCKAGRRDDVGGALALFGIGKLAGEDGLEFGLGHRATVENALALDLFRRRDDGHGVAGGVEAGFVEQRDVEEDDFGGLVGCEELRAVCGDEGMDGGVQAVKDGGVGLDQRAKGGAIDAAVLVDGGGEELADGKCRRLTGLVETVDGRVGIPDGEAFLGEHLCRGGLAHADGAGEAEDECHAASTALRVASSTSGRMPNQRSKPGAA